MRLHKIIILLFFIPCSFVVIAQTNKVTFTKEFSYGLNFNSNAGILGGFNFRFATHYNNKNIFTKYIEIVNVKSDKELRLTSSLSSNFFIYGKTNYLWPIRLGCLYEHELFSPFSENGLKVNSVLGGGLTIGIQKPYYIKYITNQLTKDYEVVPYNSQIHTTNLIDGSGGFFTGLNKATIRPGIHTKIGLNFQNDASYDFVTGVETGWLFEAYGHKIPIVGAADANAIYNSFYVNVYMGHRKIPKENMTTK